MPPHEIIQKRSLITGSVKVTIGNLLDMRCQNLALTLKVDPGHEPLAGKEVREPQLIILL